MLNVAENIYVEGGNKYMYTTMHSVYSPRSLHEKMAEKFTNNCVNVD